ncbi:hypothetical protein [Bradyrhizobium sp. SRS-191]|uniref:hypothetical protein n=1 Tax=Bradyrhizobium sp. SRS-191 TaxID=2962606 RepID=UPI00211E168E|nr:hypothetical protein [Bradyrhizobium sp. SRS-191]
MTSISPTIPTNSSPIGRSAADLVALKQQIDQLSSQLSSGRVGETFAELGPSRSDSLSARAVLSALDGYDAGIASAQPRVQLISASIAQISKSVVTFRNALANNPPGAGAGEALARDALESTIAALNPQIGGRYVFGGREDRRPPLASAAVLLDGDNSDPSKPLAGLKALVADQIRADKVDGIGRLALSRPSSTSLQLREETDPGARANFGFTLAGAAVVSSSFAAVSYSAGTIEGAVPQFVQAPLPNDRFRVVVNLPSGAQKTYDLSGADLADISSPANATSSLLTLLGTGKIASVQSATPPGLQATFANSGAAGALTIDVGRQPAAGDQLSIKLALRDGSTTTVTLQAQSRVDPDSTSDFAIGATLAETAQNVSVALGRALARAADTVLAASSTARAAQDFFAGQSAPGLAARRIDFSAATPAYAQVASTSTVAWYRGEASTTAPREAEVVRTSSTSAIAVGARANEDSLRAALVGFASIAASGSGATTAAAAERSKSLASRTLALLPTREAVDGIANDFGLAQAALSEAQSENKVIRTIHRTLLDRIETVPAETIVTELVSLQNRLQASYQVTAMISKLSLVNYLR